MQGSDWEVGDRFIDPDGDLMEVIEVRGDEIVTKGWLASVDWAGDPTWDCVPWHRENISDVERVQPRVETIQPGDVVRLKSGGPAMVVTETAGGRALVVYAVGCVRYVAVPFVCLEKV